MNVSDAPEDNHYKNEDTDANVAKEMSDVVKTPSKKSNRFTDGIYLYTF